MGKKYFLGLDQGTTGTTSLIFDENWNIVAHTYKEHKQYYPQPGWMEHDPLEIWHAVLEAIDSAVQQTGITEKDLTCIGIDNQGETVMLWDKDTGKPLYNAIVWQDRRTSKYADELSAIPGVSAMVADKCGMLIDAYFSATKIRWILDNVEGAKEKSRSGKLLAGTLDSWMIWKFTKGKCFVTDYSTASRTMLLNIHTGTWDDDILKLLDSWVQWRSATLITLAALLKQLDFLGIMFNLF